ncbi:MAG: alpha/beta hydrolase [Buchananella hordeovulneris]|nr:alpha/beta hydrolase [Buchananella hordeovulneris]
MWNRDALEEVIDKLITARQAAIDASDVFDEQRQRLQSRGLTADALRGRLGSMAERGYGLVEKLGEVMLATSQMSDAVWGLQQEVLECEQYAQINRLTIDDNGEVRVVADRPLVGLSPDGLAAVEVWSAQEALIERVAAVLRRADEVDQAYRERLEAITLGTYQVKERGRSDSQGLPDLPGQDWGPAQVATWWSLLHQDEKDKLIAERPELIGNLDGIDMASRSRANKQRIPDLLAAEEARLAELEKLVDQTSGPTGQDYPKYVLSPHQDEYERVRQRVKDLRYLNDHVLDDAGRTLTTLDTSSERVKAAVAQGDVDRAKHVAVFTPGIGSKVADSMEGYLEDMSNLRNEAMQVGGLQEKDVATVMWLGYQAPRGFGEEGGFAEYTETHLADRGADELASYLEGIQASREASGAGDPHLTALGHSYGSTTTGMAADRVRPGVIDDVLLFGSPGAGVRDDRDFNVPDGHAWVSGVGWWGDAVQGLGTNYDFGVNPMRMAGVTHLSNEAPDERDWWEFITNPFARHSVYLEPDSGTLEDFGRVVSGAR